MSTPTQRSKAKLQSEGFLVAITEHWNSFVRRRQDMFGFVDLLAIRGDVTIAVQTTSGAHVAERIAKIRSLQASLLWLDSPNRKIMVHGWAKRGERGKRKLWHCRTIELTKDG